MVSRMVSKSIIITLLSLLIVLVGCTTQEEDNDQVLGSFIGGSEGLDMNFLEGAPPQEVYDHDFPFGINLRVENMGEFDVPLGKVNIEITGIDPSDFGKTQDDLNTSSEEDMRGRHKDVEGNIIPGSILNFNFDDLQYQGNVSGQVTFNIKADACYSYGTFANSKICVLEDLLGTTKAAAFCNPNEEKTVESSGAPVKITAFREDVASKNKVRFVFTVTHAGEGSPHEKGSLCDESYSKRDWIHVKIDTGLSDGDLKCSGLRNGNPVGSGYEGDFQLYSGERSIACNQEIDDLGDYEKQVSIELTYDYNQHIVQELMVKHIDS